MYGIKFLTEDLHEISSFILPPDTHHNSDTAKEKYQEFSRALRVHIAKDDTIPSSKSLKSYVKLITYINVYSGFKILVDVVFSMSTQFLLLGTKSQYLAISFHLGEGKSLQQFYIRDIYARRSFFLFIYETEKNPSGKYIM